jgi:L-ascorbate metabolism protein UlaG (beta-lactamase superfamily)
LKALYKLGNPKIIIPLGNEKTILSAIKKADIASLGWYENYQVSDGIKIHLEPAQHWSARGLFDRNKSLWGSFIININNNQICFVGDSGYDQQMFKNIGTKFPNIKCSIIPIGAYEPRWFMSPIHMNPEEAVKVHQDLNSQQSIAGHFGTFQLTDEGYDDPLIELAKAKKRLGIKDEFSAIKIGSHIKLSL